jgi:tetratricopeptide (TPR) repeat protein
MPTENESDMNASSKPRVFRMKNFDLILAAAVMAAVLVFIVRNSPGGADRSSRALTKAGISNAARAGFSYETSEGLRYYRAMEYDRAEAAFRKSIAYSSSDAVGYNNLGTALNDEKKWDEAIVVLRRALELNPNFGLARNNLAWAESHKAQDASGGKK